MSFSWLIPKFRGCMQSRIVMRFYGASGNVPFTSERKKNLYRHDFATISDADIKAFKDILDEGGVITDEDTLKAYNTDWMRNYRGRGAIVLRPKTTNEVSALLSHCSTRKLAVVPQGGNTGLVGGSVPVFDEVIISLSRMNKIISVDSVSGVTVCESGVILEDLDKKLRENGLCAPLDLGAKGSCQLGGNISTNAGGLRLLRYGSLRSTVLGVEAVLPNGEILDCLNTLRKDNTGYDLKQLFIGGEGTLGIVTKVALNCPTEPKSVNVAFLGLESYEKVLETFKEVKFSLSEILSACELIDSRSMKCVETKMGLRNPLSTEFPFYLLIETSGSNEEHDKSKLDNFLERAINESFVSDGTVAQDAKQLQRLWTVRECIAEALSLHTMFLCYDVSLSLNDFYRIVEELDEFCQSDDRLNHLTVTGFGHLGDGNVHLNVVTEKYSPDVYKLLEPFIYQWVVNNRGSISAEHGLGMAKNMYLNLCKPPVALSLMKQLKNIFDSNGIMNPYKYLSNEDIN